MGIFSLFKKQGEIKIEPFPEIESVFDTDIENCKKVFFPVCSIRLGGINAKWGDEKIHMVQYNEDPYNEDTVKYFNEYCKDNMIAFDLSNGKYTFKTNFGYFDLTKDWEEWFDKTKTTYEKSKNDWLKNGNTFGIDKLELGGRPNWLQSDETPIDPSGKRMTFIAEFDTDAICDDYCECRIYLFYSDKHKLAIQIYQIT